MNIRRFTPDDAAFCFKIRAAAFIQKFYGELNPTQVSACVTAYLPQDYVAMAADDPFFIVEKRGSPVGFFTLHKLDQATAEIGLVYFDLNCIGRGLGAECVRYIEKWIADTWSSVTTLIVDTVIPKNNGGFYRRVGFEPEKEVKCEFAGHRMKALRFKKNLG